MRRFSVLTVTPIALEHPGLALATARAGGIAILDRELCATSDLDLAHANLRRLIDLAPANAILGLRLRASQLESSRGLLDLLREREHWIVSPDEITSPGAKIVREVTSDEELPAHAGAILDAILARGSECGGWVGGDSAFILAQKVLAATELPVYIQGGIGPATAAACRAAGAAGVVLDDQLWLMPESPLPLAHRELLESIEGQESLALGEPLGATLRVITRPGLPIAQQLQRLASEDLPAERWLEEANAHLGWGAPDTHAWPIGQAIGLAAHFRDRFKTTGRFIRAVLEMSAEQVKTAARLRPLAVDSPLARSHRTRCPIVQGPMTRVSDSPAFAAAIAAGGGLPLLALALSTGEQARTLLQETRDRLGDRSWGVGILGFVPPDTRDEQLAELTRVRPPFALIAGGRPDQAVELERHGVATYLHVPVRTLLPLFLEGGARRFVFEGRECGGHVGPLSSFVLWQSMIDGLMNDVPKSEAANIHVLFAGGIHDARSAAMVAALAAPLAERGMHVGVLMGSAYLFTEDAVACGAITEEFQQQALACRRTVKLKTGPGHVVRCAPSPFAEEFEALRRRLTTEGKSNDEINDALARLALGRSRAGAKGVMREGDALVPLDRDRQRREGMFMMGSLATMRHEVVTIEALHDDVAIGGTAILEDATPEVEVTAEAKPADVAVIGIAAMLPGASVPRAYWRNILDKYNAITEVPRHRWDWRLLYSEDPKEKDKTVSKWGGFLDEIPFDPVRFGIPPNSMTQISTSQLLALEAARQAIADAGYENGDFDREHTSVILGAAANGDLEQGFMIRSLLPFIVDNPTAETWQRLPEWSDEAFAGVLANVTAGRIANRLDLGGANYAVDAACASSLTAIDLAVHELRNGHSSMVVAGGLDLEQHPHFFLGFARTQALSPRGKVQTFDKHADGIVISEGVVVVVLKRLADAERDGDRIYAVIKGIAGSSDGKALGMTAPRPIGQKRAVARAYRAAGFSPSTIGLYEAHGTGTPVGDRAELETIVGTLDAAGAAAKSCAVGSVKSLIGHTKAAAGMAGLVKAIYALHYRTLPPHYGVEEPLDPIANPRGPAYLLREPRPWFDDGQPRRAGVSAFGFGGTNFHAVLEEYRGGVATRAAGHDEWPFELVVVRAQDQNALLSSVRALRASLQDAGSLEGVGSLSAIAAQQAKTRGDALVAIVTDSVANLRKELDRWLEGGATAALPGKHRVAFLFPGQGAQHVNMGRELALYTPEVRAAIELADRLTRERYDAPLSRIVFPEAAFTPEAEAEQAGRVDDTHVAQPAIGALSLGMLDLARRLGLQPAMVAGHSFGELTALHAAGVLDRESFLRLAETRGRLMATAEAGAMAAVTLPADEIPAFDDVVIANRNAPRQTVISGPRAAIEAAVAKLTANGIQARMLPVSGAFHSPLMSKAEAPLVEAIRDCELNQPRLPVYGNTTAQPYPNDVDALRAQLEGQLRSAVDFADEIRNMARDGATLFVELGPKSILTNLVQQILGDSVPAVSFGTGGLRGMLTAVATLLRHGVEVDVAALFAGRDVAPRKEAAPSSQVWLVDGGGVRRTREEPRSQIGKLPRLDLEAVQKNAEKPMTRPTAPSPQPQPAQAAQPATPSSELLEGYKAYQETMRQFLAVQESVMARFLGASAGAPAMPIASMPVGVLPAAVVAPSAPVVAPAAEPVTFAEPVAVAQPVAKSSPANQPPAAAASLDRAATHELITRLVSARTGYPSDVLGLEDDLEAELGIDSIKRLEIVDALLKQLPATQKPRADELLRMKTLKGWIEVVLRAQTEVVPALPVADAAPPVNEASPAAEAAPQDAPPEQVGSRAPRFVIRGVEEPAPLFSLTHVRGLFLITEDGFGVAPLVADSLRQLGGEASIVSRDVLASREKTEAFVNAEREEYGAVQGIVHLASLVPSDAETLEAWRRDTDVGVKSLFDLIQLALPDLQAFGLEGECYVLGAALLGGAWGRNGVCGPGSAAAGGVYGVVKTLVNEITGVHGKAVDFDSVAHPSVVASKVVNELLARGDDFEIGYADGIRSVFRAELANVEIPKLIHDPQPLIHNGDVVLLTGGARGITAEVAREFAQPGVRIVLAGRSAEPHDEDAATRGKDIPELRLHFLDSARNAGGKITPAQVEEKIRALQQRREVQQNLVELRRGGAEVEYRSADVRDERSLAALLDHIHARYGRLDGVVHGAGIIDDCLLAEKNRASFDRVFDTKADSAFLLARMLPSSLRFVVLFSSVAGRIGNRGQVDYAAANEVANRIAWQMAAHRPSTRVVAINWGPWTGAGMASPGVIRQLEERGIEAITLDAGRRFLSDELLSGATDAEVIAGEGYWNPEHDAIVSVLGHLL